MSIVELKRITKCYNSTSVVDQLDLKIEKAEVLGLFGHNGAGKTTTMKMILGLLKPTSGELKVFGEDPCHSNFSRHKYKLGFLPENVAFYSQLSGLEVLQFFAKLKKVSRKRCLELLDQVGLGEAKNRKVKTYSKGMRQRLGLAQALLTEPSLLLLDEPTVGLDPVATQQFYQIVDQLRLSGCSIVLCSHVLPGVEKHIDRAAILSKGCLRAYGSLNQLRSETPLTTIIRVGGYFELEHLTRLTQSIDGKVRALTQGGFEFEVSAENKLKTIEILMHETGLKDLDTMPPSLEQLYRYYMEDNALIKDSEFTKSNDCSQRQVN